MTSVISITFSKPMWRKELQARRSAIDDSDRIIQRASALDYMAAVIAQHRPRILGLYFPIRDEILPLSDALQAETSLAIPIIHGEHLTFAAWTAHTPMQEGAFRIPEPVTPHMVIPDVIITPLVGVDKTGTRLGYGKGYYDRYFTSDVGKNAYRIGLAFSCQQIDTLPHEAHDVKLHALVTDKGVTYF